MSYIICYTVVMNTFDLLCFADNNNIPVYDFKTGNKKAFCTADAIAIDFNRIENERESKAILSEELAHVITGALYPLHYCGNALYKSNIEKQERRAHDYSLRLQVPLSELRVAIAHGTTDFEIAEILDINVDTLHDVVDYYKRKGMLE